MTAAMLIIDTVPLAGLLIASERREWSDLFVVCYVAAIGLLVSLGGALDDYYDFTSFLGLVVDPD